MTEWMVGALGLIGALCPVTMYFLLEMERIDARSFLFYLVNAVGSILIMAASAMHYDAGNIGILVMEAVWFAISIKGMVKVVKQRKSNA